ncbi:MAG: hypothetical protein L0220_14120 [Acidobacteria bacterium]|nr:hypothetical protein [Acidobacteriota bacterium]
MLAIKREPSSPEVSRALPSPTASPTPDLPPSELLAKAKKLLVQPSTSDFTAAMTLLHRIPPEAKESKEASTLKVKITKERERAKAVLESAERRDFAGIAERNLLSKGFDVTVLVNGPENRTLRITYVLMSRPLVYQLTNDHGFLETAQARGFHKVIFSDGYNRTWRYTYDEKAGYWK